MSAANGNRTKPPVKEVQIVLTITESTSGRLSIQASIPSHSAGTIALVVAEAAMTVMRGMMSDAGVREDVAHEGQSH